MYSENRFLYILQAGIKLTILIPHPSAVWDYRHVHHTQLNFSTITQSFFSVQDGSQGLTHAKQEFYH
jgi:hypothetical protein